jgi:hypothetical protein
MTVTSKVAAVAIWVVLVTALAGCGSSGDDENGASDGEQSAAPSDAASDGGSSGGDGVVDPQPPGQAMVSVDGQEYVLDMPGALDCTIEDDTFTFSFRIGDNEVTLGGGANEYDGKWVGSIDLVVADPTGEPGPIRYTPDLVENGASGLAFDGDSMSYSGPMQKQPANDGSQPQPVDVGDGTISVTCP